MPPRNSVVLFDAVGIKGAHQLRCWNSIRKAYRVHSVPICIEEATRLNRHNRQLVPRSYEEIAGEINVADVTDSMRASASMALVRGRIDVDAGERDLLAYALSLGRQVWWLCGPDNGTVRALEALKLLDRMVTLEGLARGSGQTLSDLPTMYSDKWLADWRLKLLLGGF